MITHDRFLFNNIDSYSMNVAIIWDGSGLQNQSMFQKMLTEDKNSLNGVEITDLEFTIKIALFDDSFSEIMPLTINKRREIIDWLCKDVYLPFQSAENQSILYYVVFTEVTKHYMTSSSKGYIELKAKCDSAYACSHYDLIKITVDGTANLRVPNKGDILAYPSIEIRSYGEEDVIIRNRTNGDSMTIRNNKENEIIKIDCNDLFVKSNLVKNKYKDFSRTWIALPRGINLLEITGDCKFQIKYQHHFLI